MDLTDKPWAVLEPLLGKPVVREDGRGSPWRDARDVLNGASQGLSRSHAVLVWKSP